VCVCVRHMCECDVACVADSALVGLRVSGMCRFGVCISVCVCTCVCVCLCKRVMTRSYV